MTDTRIPALLPHRIYLLALAVAALLFSASVALADGSSGTGTTPNATSYALTLATTGAGSGNIAASPVGPTYAPGTTVTLTATPTNGSTFAGWSGASCGDVTTCKISNASSLTLCGTQTTCQINMGTTNVVILASFTPAAAASTFTLTTSTAGSGSGTIAATPSGPNYASGTVVTLIATPASGSAFGGWAGDCGNASSSSCTITMNSNHAVSATFTASSTAPAGTYSLITGVRGSGAVAASPSGPTYAPGTTVTLTATPWSGATLSGWSAASCGTETTCKVPASPTLTLCGTQPTCQITMGATNVVVLADFVSSTSSSNGDSGGTGSGGGSTTNTFTLTTASTGSGTGTVAASPSGPTYAAGTVVTLTATPGGGSTFGGWSGDCASPTSTSCVITMNSNHSVAATFASSFSAAATLSVNVSGGGTVKSSPGGIDCGATCAASFSVGQSVLLVADAGSGSQFGGWSGCTTATGTTCWVTLTSNTSVTASFGAGAGTAVRQGTISSSAQGTVKSFLRFYNAGSSAGTVAVTLADSSTGQTVGQWTSPSIASGTAPQFAISDLEAAMPSGTTLPNTYSAVVQSQFDGTFQHVTYTSGDTLLMNLSTCDSGVTTIPSRLVNVHSAQLASMGFPSTIMLYNTGTTAAAATLAVYDASNASLLGTYTTAAVPPNGQLAVPVSAIEGAASITPTADMMYYVVSVQGTFTGFLRHLVNNTQVGVLTDMSVVCALDGTPATAGSSSGP